MNAEEKAAHTPHARLIASAPRMFDALNGLVGLIQLVQSDRPDLLKNHRYIEACDALAEASEREGA